MNGSDRATKKPSENEVRSSENLAFLYQGLFTGIVRLQAGREHMPDAETFRRRTKRALEEVERDATVAGYNGDDIKQSHFAVASFLDSVVLHSTEAGRAEWERQSLAEELFGIANAGEVFFDKLDDLRTGRDSHRLADVLEVYLLCLLLGFEGRYSGGLRGELSSIAEKVRRRIDDIRGRPGPLSPTGRLPEAVRQPQAPVAAVPFRRYALLALAALAVTILCFILLKMDLAWEAERASGRLF